jgi:hypothetical protein
MDIRLPLGVIFSLYGVILVGAGVLGKENVYERSVGININLVWGVVLLAFGILMFLLGWFGGRRDSGAR